MRADRVKELVRNYYAKYAAVEWERLTKHPYHRLEFDTTLHFLKKYLPRKGLVLDAGGRSRKIHNRACTVGI
ncbi:MAG: hypothetical protein OEY31_06720 [Candidatus Bathyarchaeota archaeon]|nr:hypothetical protein [Candidatus Bathyarchaeota archaeon]